jgi:hypothetical protein
MTIKNALDSYSTLIKCIYQNKSEKKPQLSNTVLELVANELFLLNVTLYNKLIFQNLSFFNNLA